jgi:hypothetical protein
MTKFYNIQEIYTKAQKYYSSGKVFVDYIEGTILFPLTIRLKKLKQSDLSSYYSFVINEIAILQKEDLELVYRDFQFKNIGEQRLPTAVYFENRDRLLRYLAKEDEFFRFQETYEKIISYRQMLSEMIHEKVSLVLAYEDVWEKLFLVCDFFVANPKPNIYTRELSIAGVDTKFIEKYKKILDMLLSILLDDVDIDKSILSLPHYGFEKKYGLKYPLATVRFRILDMTQEIEGMDDISLTIEAFKKLQLPCKRVYIVENKITTLSFPNIAEAIVIFGSGYGVEVLKNVEWLKDKEIYYWGDIDRDGFAILSQARGYFPYIKSLLMDEVTIDKFRELATQEKQSTRTKKALSNLTSTESIVYDNLLNDTYGKRFRLEQERIDFKYVLRSVSQML